MRAAEQVETLLGMTAHTRFESPKHQDQSMAIKNRVSQALTGRIRQLAERYATPLPRLAEEVDTLAARVDEHLKTMGWVWN